MVILVAEGGDSQVCESGQFSPFKAPKYVELLPCR